MNNKNYKKINKFAIFLEKIIFWSRWLQAPIYLLLILVLIAFIYQMAIEVKNLFYNLYGMEPHHLVVIGLTLCDMVLIANLIVIVIISGYENFVSKINVINTDDEPIWIKKLSPNGVKLKVSGSIVAISSISLLKHFLDIPKFDNRELIWHVIIHITFLISSLILVITNILENNKEK